MSKQMPTENLRVQWEDHFKTEELLAKAAVKPE